MNFSAICTWLVQPSCSISLNDEASASVCVRVRACVRYFLGGITIDTNDVCVTAVYVNVFMYQ